MRRATNTINYSDELPLAQGVEFELSFAFLLGGGLRKSVIVSSGNTARTSR